MRFKLRNGTPVDVMREGDGLYIITFSYGSECCAVRDIGNCYAFEHAPCDNGYVASLEPLADEAVSADVVACYCYTYGI